MAQTGFCRDMQYIVLKSRLEITKFDFKYLTVTLKHIYDVIKNNIKSCDIAESMKSIGFIYWIFR